MTHTMRPLSLLLLLGALGLAACDGSSGDDAGMMPGDDAGPMDVDAGPMEVDAGPMMVDAGPASGVPIDGSLVDRVTGAVVAGAQVCVLDHPEVPCTTSDADGVFLLMADLSGPVALDVTHDDYFSGIFHLEVDEMGGSFLGAPLVALAFAGLFDATGAPADPTKAHLASGLMFMDGGPALGATVTITPASGIGPVYFAGGGPDPSATGITDGPFAAINLDPGEVTVTYSHPSATCARRARASWPAADPTDLASTRLVLRAGHISVFGTAFCEPTP